jgi:actin related protein 2/3 complex subunit 1A/1B
MSPPEIYPLSQTPITAHAFSADRKQVAVSLNSSDAQIYSKKGPEWKLTETLAEHDKQITSIDWAPATNRIVTASQDRNAYVWQQTPEGTWKPTLVLLRINRAATYVRWSPFENKFAVASGARMIAICSFDSENDWWVSKPLKKPIRSTVLSVDWHPNNVLLAAGSADMKARVFSAYIKDVDDKPPPSVWGEKLPFNTICGEYTSPAGGWVHAVGFSPSGDVLAFASHDSSISVVYPTGPTVINIRITSLPFVTLTFTSEDSLVAAGHDCQPILFSGSASGWAAVGSLDDTTAPKSASAGSRVGGVGRLNSTAFNTFKNADSRGSGGFGAGSDGGGETDLMTVHQNTITSVRAYSGGKVTTSGVDGKLVVWDVGNVSGGGNVLAGRMGGMHLR